MLLSILTCFIRNPYAKGKSFKKMRASIIWSLQDNHFQNIVFLFWKSLFWGEQKDEKKRETFSFTTLFSHLFLLIVTSMYQFNTWHLISSFSGPLYHRLSHDAHFPLKISVPGVRLLCETPKKPFSSFLFPFPFPFPFPFSPTFAFSSAFAFSLSFSSFSVFSFLF